MSKKEKRLKEVRAMKYVLMAGLAVLLCAGVVLAQVTDDVTVTVAPIVSEAFTVTPDAAPTNKKFDIVVDATGSPSGFEQALARVKPRGKLVLKSTVAGASTLPLAPIVIDEVTVVGSRCGPFTPALRALQEGSVDVAPLISSIFEPEAFEKAFETSKEDGVLKVLLDFRGR